MDSLARKATQVEFFIILAIFYNHLSLYRLRVSEWFQWDGKFVQFLEIVCRWRKRFKFKRHSFCNLRWSVTPWILQIGAYERKQHGPRIGSGTDLKCWKFRLVLATITGPAIRSYPKNMAADVQHALKKCEPLGSGKQLILHGNPSAIAEDFFTAHVSSSTSFLTKYAAWVLWDCPGH